jgi:hypothetical protein
MIAPAADWCNACYAALAFRPKQLPHERVHVFRARSTESSLRRQHAARSQRLPEILVLMLKDNLGYTVLEIQDERGIDLDIDRWCRGLLKTPYDLSAHHYVMVVHPRFM